MGMSRPDPTSCGRLVSPARARRRRPTGGCPPRWAYSTRDPAGISPERTMPISPAIDLPS